MGKRAKEVTTGRLHSEPEVGSLTWTRKNGILGVLLVCVFVASVYGRSIAFDFTHTDDTVLLEMARDSLATQPTFRTP